MKRTLLFLFFCTAIMFCKAQLKADFTTSDGVLGGCSPFTVLFKNITTGATSKAIYKWDFGNNNTSSLINPGAFYTTEKTYTITLTVTDNGNTSTKKLDIIVYKKPTVDFTISTTKGCVPLTTTFTSNATPGDGKISNYFWDFGDGTTRTDSGLVTLSHTFTSTKSPRVDLIVTNSFGCQNLLRKSAAIEIQPQPIADFTVTNSVLCNTTDAVVIKNNSTGVGVLNYVWNLGDNSNSNTTDPSHIYKAKGVYDITLTVNSNFGIGCTNTLQKAASVSVANFSSDIVLPVIICSNSSALFQSQNSGIATSTQWFFSDDNFQKNIAGNNATKVFLNTGLASVKMINMFGNCKDTVAKNFVINQSPLLTNFSISNDIKCSLPASVTVNDTSNNVVKWFWNLPSSNMLSATTQGATILYQQEGSYPIDLTITNKDGCSASTNKIVVVQSPKIVIVNRALNNIANLSGCSGLSVGFEAISTVNIASYIWDFGDSTATSTAVQPTHIFNKLGTNKVSLKYVTNDGCTGISLFEKNILVYEKPIVSFVASDSLVCGSGAITFTDTSSKYITTRSWFFGDNMSVIGTPEFNNKIVMHKYNDSGYYNVKLIAYNNTCSDSVENKKLVRVLPLFGGITKVDNTCIGLRDSVYFNSDFRFADNVTWSYGDGTSEIINTLKTNTVHRYSQSGTYKISVSASNNICNYKDSAVAFVLLKQSPKLLAEKEMICLNDSLNIQINQLENIPSPNKNYVIYQWQLNDGGNFKGNTNLPVNSISNNSFLGKLWSLQRDAQAIRVILKTENFGCMDTSNYINITANGPNADFTILNNQSCFKQPFNFKDISKNNGVNIIERQWFFGDGNNEFRTDMAQFTHNFTTPGSYNVQLKITDNNGCFSLSQNRVTPLQVIGPKVDFTVNPNIILAGTTATYTNVSNAFGSNATSFLWSFSSNGSTSTSATTINKFYNNSITIDTVKLIAKNTTTQCADTMIKIVPIKRMGLAFTLTTQYINNESCPPLVAYFKTTLQAVNSISWNFGDGTIAGNNPTPSHTYYKPGIYKITLYGFGNNNLTDSVFDYITIKGPYATLHTTAVQSCVPATVTLSATAINTTTYVWDFGDGTLSDRFDTVAQHQYTIAGIYNPALIIKDSAGCSSVFNLPNPLIIDTLQANILLPIQSICKAGNVAFLNVVNSLSDSLNPSLTQYHWAFGSGNTIDTSTIKNPVFYYSKVGKYQVSLSVLTASGCKVTTYDSITVKPIAVSNIIAPKTICESDSILFSATSSITNDLQYSWAFGNGKVANIITPAPQKFQPSITPYNITLISTLNGCSDTSSTTILVHANPIVNITPKTKNICLGDSILLTANDGSIYQWQTDTTINKNIYWAKPNNNRNYLVTVTNEFGCVSKDVATITVTKPFKLSVTKNAIVCQGASLSLQAIGASTVKWLNNTADLSNSNIANPTVKTNTSKQYMVVGYDGNNCFTDTAIVPVTVMPLPKVAKVSNITIGTGGSTTISANASSDVVKWSWSPSTYLSCSNCQSPIATPRADMLYIVTATTQYGCEAKDSLSIKLQCQEKNLFIPSAFTPNKDRLNDYFYPLGKGIRSVKHFVIFNRAGEKFFERSNFNINEAAMGWNGTFKSLEVQSGVYVYMIEVECDTGDIFSTKGTVTLIR
ncbi:MAG: PKD domain-containing protein [Pedobacter sp.]|nr:PKD domain-containing protein [Chitinophagaceae bacterium]